MATAARKAREWTLRRDALIREASANGQSNRAIAIETGLSHTAIANILSRVPSPPTPESAK